MRVIAIDPGFGRCGVAILEGNTTQSTLLYSSCIETPSSLLFPERLYTIISNIDELIASYTPEIMSIEEVYYSSNQKTVFRVAEVRGALIFLSKLRQLELREFNPLSIKIALTGHGRAPKDQVTSMTKKLIHIPHKPKHDDEYDAIALGLTTLATGRNRG